MNPGLIEKYFEENRSIILYMAHQGNWEWLAFLPLSSAAPCIGTLSTAVEPLF